MSDTSKRSWWRFLLGLSAVLLLGGAIGLALGSWLDARGVATATKNVALMILGIAGGAAGFKVLGRRFGLSRQSSSSGSRAA